MRDGRTLKPAIPTFPSRLRLGSPHGDHPEAGRQGVGGPSRRLVAERRVPFYKVGKFVRFDPDRIDAWLATTSVDST